MSWKSDLAYFVTPKDGPVRPMRTLLDANRALVSDLPTGYLRRTHWMNAGQLPVAAAESGLEADVRSATDALVSALVTEGWMTHRRK